MHKVFGTLHTSCVRPQDAQFFPHPGSSEDAIFAGVIGMVFGRDLQDGWNGLVVLIQPAANHLRYLFPVERGSCDQLWGHVTSCDSRSG